MKEDNKILTILLLLLSCTVAVLCYVIANITYVEFETIKLPWIIQSALYMVVLCYGFVLGRWFGDK